MIKKVLIGLLLAALLIPTLIACNGTSSTTTDTTTSNPTDTSPTAPKPSPTVHTPLPNPEVGRVTADELKQMIDTNADFVLVDTRDENSYDNGHIEGAINIPSYPGGQPLFNKLKALPTGKEIIFYCA